MAQAFTIALAGRSIEIRPQYAHLRTLCAAYLTSAPPDLTVTVTPEDIAYERQRAAEAATEGDPVPHFSEAYGETLAVHRKIARAMVAYDTLLFHGSAVAVDGQAYLFTALSGTGKSTHTRLWCQHFGSRAFMVNDDKPFLRLLDGKVYACGSPWDGKHRLSTPTQVPLKALCLLERGEKNRIEPISRREALPQLLQQSYRPEEPAQLERALALLDAMTAALPLYRLYCNQEPSAAVVAYEGMGGNAL